MHDRKLYNALCLANVFMLVLVILVSPSIINQVWL